MSTKLLNNPVLTAYLRASPLSVLQRTRFHSDNDRPGDTSTPLGDFRDRIKTGPGLGEFIEASRSAPNTIDAAENRTVFKTPGERLRLPEWLKTDIPHGGSFTKISKDLRSLKLHTVCEEARCPNIGECWGGGSQTATATIMIMGDTCTRACRFCSVKTSPQPPALDPEEPVNTAEAVVRWSVDYIVITSVDRDDLADGGAGHIAETVRQIKRRRPSLLLECLVPDFRGDLDAVREVVAAGPEVYAHNLETVESLQRSVRDRRAGYRQSLHTLEAAKLHAAQVDSRRGQPLVTKSSLMLGLGEVDEEVVSAMRDLRLAGVDCLTLGQYVQPTKRHLKVSRAVSSLPAVLGSTLTSSRDGIQARSHHFDLVGGANQLFTEGRFVSNLADWYSHKDDWKGVYD